MADPVEIPLARLSADALRGLLEEFVSREGTDYGSAPQTSLAAKVEDVRRQLERGEAAILFDPDTGTTNIVPRGDLP